MINFDPKIQPGDTFVRQWGSREIILVMLPRGAAHAGTARAYLGAKQPYLRVGGGTDSGWWVRRSDVKGRGKDRKQSYRFVGAVPAWFIEELRSPESSHESP